MGIYILMIINTICTSILIWVISISYLLTSTCHTILIDIMQECYTLTDKTLYIHHYII